MLANWWHRRTDEVSGIDKLIGEPGSMYREFVTKPLCLLAIGVVIWKVLKPRG